jgi:hypothetical protein
MKTTDLQAGKHFVLLDDVIGFIIINDEDRKVIAFANGTWADLSGYNIYSFEKVGVSYIASYFLNIEKPLKEKVTWIWDRDRDRIHITKNEAKRIIKGDVYID